MFLVVVQPFGPYRRGDPITDPEAIAAISASPNIAYCVVVGFPVTAGDALAGVQRTGIFGVATDQGIAASARAGSVLHNIVYDASGRVVSYDLAGITVGLTYDARWRVATITEQGVTRTVYYDASGRVTGFY